MKFVDVKNDVAFHKIFGNANKTGALVSFLNAVLFPEGDNRVVSVTVENPYLFPPVPAGKTSILDLKATDQEGRKFIVELQVADAVGFDKRVQYYTCREYSGQISRGDDYLMLRPTYLIGILDFNFTKNPHYFSAHQTMDTETGENLLKDVKYFFIELKKFNKAEAELVSTLDKWTYFIKNAPNLEIIPANVNDEGLKSAYLDADQQTWTKKEREAYDGFYVYLTDLAMRELAAERKGMKEGREKGLEEGREKGLEEGREKGLEEGREKGLEEGREKGLAEGREEGLEEGLEKGKREREAQIVLSMHAAGLAMHQIAAIAGISEADVEAIISGAKR